MNPEPILILLAEDDPAHVTAIQRAFEASGSEFRIQVVGTLQEFRRSVAGRRPAIAVMDLNLPDGRAAEVLTQPPEAGPFPILVMTSYGNEQVAVAAIKAGALDYAVKSPEAFAEMPHTITRVLHEWSLLQERKRAEEKLLAFSSRQEAILAAVPDIIMEVDNHKVYTWANQAGIAFFGKDVIGKEAAFYFEGEQTTYPTVQPLFEGRQDTIYVESWQRRKDGEKRLLAWRCQVLKDENGNVNGALSSAHDITEKKRLEAQLLRTQRLESVGRLASGVAHDLNNILAPMLMAPPLLREELQDPELRSLVDLIETNAQRGSDIIKQLLTFGRGMEGERVPVQLRALVQDMAGIIRETFPKNITVRRETPPETWPVKGDATQLHQILMNLCVNARDAMPKGGAITFKLENHELDESAARMTPGARPGRYVCLSVADTGQGIAPEHLDKIYDPFFTTKEPGQGTGLGLATALGIVQSHGGFIQVQSQPGHGTQFKVYLPASETAEVRPASPANQPIPQGHGELLLMVDDEESVRQVARQLLECNGYRMIEAENGTTGIVQYMAHQQEVQVVVTDLIMPVMDGPAFIRVLRRMNPQVRVIVMTGHQDKSGLPADLRMPDEARLAKPFSGAMLVQTLQRVLHPEAPPKN